MSEFLKLEVALQETSRHLESIPLQRLCVCLKEGRVSQSVGISNQEPLIAARKKPLPPFEQLGPWLAPFGARSEPF